jgi:iron complex outermembrane receptor protein
MKLRISLAMLAFLPFLAMAQLSIKGRVIDAQTGTSLQGAHLNLNNRLVKVTTDETGMFEITGLKAGNYKMKVSYLGFKAWESLFELDANKTMLISMEQAAILTDETIISSTRANNKTPVAFQNLSGKEISKQDQGRDIPFLLEQMPATVVTSDAGAGVGYTGFRIRGTDMNRINITVNGIPLNDAESHGLFWVNMPDFASSVGSLQVQRGVGTSTNGAAAFGASVNLQTATPSPEAYGSITNSNGPWMPGCRNSALTALLTAPLPTLNPFMFQVDITATRPLQKSTYSPARK